jgi:hypothetical protein
MPYLASPAPPSADRRDRRIRHGVTALAAAPIVPAQAGVPSTKRAPSTSFIAGLNKIATLSSAVPTKGPAEGDENPYGVAVVAKSKGSLVRGSVLVSNFNNAKNQQGTGSSIVEISPSGSLRAFAVVPRPTSTPAVGLTTAGTQVAVKNLIPSGGGDLFGLALAPSHRGIYFVDDAGSGKAANSLRLLQ